MLYYAIADLHGRLDLLIKAHNAILDAHISDEPYHIITMGDYIDRGPDSKGVIEYLMSESTGNTFISLMGNHEAMMIETIRKPLEPDWWIGNGGDKTLKSYGCNVRSSPYGFAPIGYDPHSVLPEHIDWLQRLPLYYETPHHIFVHAGIPQDSDPLDQQDEEKMVWMLYNPRDHGGWKGKHIVHGHHQFADGPHTWDCRTDLDTYAWKTGRLVIGVFSSDKPGKAIRYIEVLGDDYEGASRLSKASV